MSLDELKMKFRPDEVVKHGVPASQLAKTPHYNGRVSPLVVS